MSDWRKWPKVSRARHGGANSGSYPKCGDPDCTGWWETEPHDTGNPWGGDLAAWVPGSRNLLPADAEDTGPRECMWCSEPATRLCDTLLRGRTEAGDLDLYRQNVTCDAAMCEAHATQLTTILSSGVNTHWSDTMDACPYCAGRIGPRRAKRTEWRETDYVSASLWRERVEGHAKRAKGVYP